MRAKIAGVVVMLILAVSNCTSGEEGKETPVQNAAANSVVRMKTSMGDITVELWADKAPETVKNFLAYVDDKFYDGTIFHRVMASFMIQGGGFTPDMTQKRTKPPVKNEASAAASNQRGTLAMARTGEPHSATAQFFINVVDNPALDHKDETEENFGYCVFGRVTAGMDVVDKIKAVRTRTVGPHKNVPVEPVVIQSVTRVTP